MHQISKCNLSNVLTFIRQNFFDAFTLKINNKSNVDKGPKSWMTKGILITSIRKRELYKISKWCKDPKLLTYRYKLVFKKFVKAA